MNRRAIRAMMRKDLRQVTQNKLVWMPMVIVPALLQVVIPLGIVLIPTFLPAEAMDPQELAGLLRALPGRLKEMLQNLEGVQQWVYLSANYMFAPLFLVVPLMVSSILAADSFAGEKERKTLESLLYTPVSDEELFLAKVLGAFLPALVISVASFLVYALAVNTVGYRIMGRIFFPAPTWWPMVFWLGPGVSLSGLGATVLLSSKVSTFMQAQQGGGLLVLPIVALMIGQLSGAFYLGPWLVFVLGTLAWLIGLWLIWVGAKTFSRSEIIARI
ncbi:MAG: ABC transporter permease subunit [Chloroflexi bacterium]|nr:ABC transporter permease subunit [Chloroflexota bacterium]